MTRPDPRLAIRRLYHNRWGYDVTRAEEDRVRDSDGSSTYGEIMPTGLDSLIDALDLEEDDVFYDLGSGMGKVILQLAMTTRIKRCVGVELVDSRHYVAREVLEQARGEGLLQTEDVDFRLADMLRTPLSDATVIYTCSTAFSELFMDQLVARLARLNQGIRLATLLDLDDNPWFEVEDVVRVDVSWKRRAKVHIYRLAMPCLG